MNNSTLQMTRRLLCHHLLLTGLLLASAICPTTAAENKGGGNADAASAQSTRQSAVIEGVIKDADGAPIVGATVAVKGSAIGALTDAGGHYILNNVPAGSILSVSYVGMKPQEITVGNAARQTINVKMEMDAIDEVVVVAFGTQKKESIVSSIETINPKELKVPSSNLTTALAGRMSGVIAYQRSGEPGADGADFFIRGVTSFGYKVDPLILIDGIESTKTDLSRLQPDDIAAFSILKDATATALYGARGANGVIQVSTKTGEVGAARISLRFENSFSMNNKDIELADPVTFMKLANEAARTRNPLAPLEYSQEKIDRTARGDDPYLYPANDWYSMLMKKVTTNQRLNMNISGGGNVARYYIAGTLNMDNGNLKVDKRNNFNSNINLKTYQVRSNININLSKSTEGIVRMSGTFDDYRGTAQERTGDLRDDHEIESRTLPRLLSLVADADDQTHPLRQRDARLRRRGGLHQPLRRTRQGIQGLRPFDARHPARTEAGLRLPRKGAQGTGAVQHFALLLLRGFAQLQPLLL